MKKVLLILAAAAISTAASAQTETKVKTTDPVTGAKTTTKAEHRDNGTVKVESETRTGRTKAGEMAHNTGEDVKMAGHKTGHVMKRAGQKTGHAMKKAGHAVKKTTKEVVD